MVNKMVKKWPNIVLNINETEIFDSSSEDEVEIIDQVPSDSD